MKSILTYFEAAIKAGASDVHLVGEEKPRMRVNGQLAELDDKFLPNEDLEKDIFELLDKDLQKKFNDELELDLSLAISGERFRVNLHRELGRIGLSARTVPKQIPSPEELNFEPALLKCTDLLDGLVLVVGPTGHGKSTTLASLIEEINKNRKSHIITIEDPIEFLFEDKMSLIEQREIGTDTKSFAAALKHVLRQDPNVILIGEMRDPETIAAALTAAETGHLVFSTLHTGSASEAIERIADVFDGSKQKQILLQLSSVLRVVVAQQLLPAKDGKLVAAREILINTPAVANLIKENNASQILSAIQTGAKDGMLTMEKSLEKLAAAGIIDETFVKKRSGKSRAL